MNIALIFGVALIFAPVRVQWQQLRRDFVHALIIPLLSFWFSVNAMLSRIEGGLLLMIFVLSPWVRRNPNWLPFCSLAFVVMMTSASAHCWEAISSMAWRSSAALQGLSRSLSKRRNLL
ncbi:MAG: hypothetical protein KGZ88_07755 [Methylomicrobium sp.]|nr:hypothetical protein [Methylomicrobium sp.]